MFRKIVKVFLLILVIGFIGVYFKGYTYQLERTNRKINVEESISETKQDIIDNSVEVGNNEDNKENVESKELPKRETSNNNENTKDNKKSNSVINKVNNNKVNEIKTEEENDKIENESIANNTNNLNKDNSEDKQESTTPKEEVKKYIGIPSPHDYYYSVHHGVIDFRTSDYPGQDISEVCRNKGIEISFKDTDDILNTSCYDVTDDRGTILGEYLEIECKSGNCNKYKN